MFSLLIAASAALSPPALLLTLHYGKQCCISRWRVLGLDFHLGFEGGDVNFYVRGPSFIHSEAADDTETELSARLRNLRRY